MYLTPDSDNLLESIDHSKVYVIGGIVDDNQLKGLSLSKAVSHGIAHARLPIKERLPNFRNQSLNINHSAFPTLGLYPFKSCYTLALANELNRKKLLIYC